MVKSDLISGLGWATIVWEFLGSIGVENGPVRAASGSKVAISPCQEPESGMSGDIDRGSNPRVEGRRGFRWRVETALALATFSCSRVREERGDGVKHSTTPDGQGVTTRSSVNQKTNPSSPTDEFPRIVDRDSTFARTTSASTRYTLPWITESASIPFCARETPLLPTRQPVLPVSLVVTR